MVQALGAHRVFDADVTNQVSPVPRQSVDAFKQKAGDFAGNFKDDLKASVTFPLSLRSLETSG